MDCEFCRYFMAIEPQRIVYEDEEYMAFTARESLVNGHCVVMPKDHADFIGDIPDMRRFFSFIGFLAQSIKDAVRANHIRIETRYGNDNKKIKHAHMHLIPVFLDAGAERAAGEIKNTDERILENLRKSQWYSVLNK